MKEWWEEEFRPFRLTDDGQFYQAVGTEGNPERIEAIEIIKALDEIATRKDIKGIRIGYGIIDGDLDVNNAKKLKRLLGEKGAPYIKLPEIVFIRESVFCGDVDFFSTQFKSVDFSYSQFDRGAKFQTVRFEKLTSFDSVQFKEVVDFRFAQFHIPAVFTGVKYWSDSPRITFARWFWKDGKLLRRCVKSVP